jgi:hypothetical protein
MICLLLVVPTIAVCAFLWAKENDRWFMAMFAAFTSGGIMLLFVLYQVMRHEAQTRQFSASAVRSLPPILAAATIAIAIVAGPVLTHIERSRVQQIQAELNWPDMSYEIERSDFRFVRERIVTGQWPDEAKAILNATHAADQ